MSDLQSQLQSALGSAFSIERELGGGGMSRVFVAIETAMERRVVIKVLSPELAAGVSADRFGREIKLAAQLQHPNVVPVFTAGEAAGLPYYTMPFVDGFSLRTRLERNGALPIAEAVSVLSDVARALGFAHERGVVHRDIKPENVLLAGDAAVVTDFGIAKAVSVSRTNAPGGTLTAVGTSIGTPDYMSPEQVGGDPDVDQRADFYSFGCMAYEVLTGATPFHGRPMHKVLAAHIAEAPAPVTAARPETPAPLAQIVMRCLEKDPARRPQSAREILQALQAATVATSGPTLSPRPKRAWTPLAIGAMLVLAALFGVQLYRGRPGGTAPPAAAASKMLAVIPFTNVGGDSAQEYLADGITDELSTVLDQSGVRLASRSGSYRYKGKRDLDVKDVGRTLDVANVLQGSVRSAGGRLKVTAYLTSAADGSELWSQNYERDAKDVFKLQAELAASITDALQSKLAASSRGAAPATGQPATAADLGTTNPEAYDLYLRAQYALQRRREGLDGAVGLFEQALAKDPKFARAHSGLATALTFTTWYSGVRPAADYLDRAEASARRALAIDSTIPEAHVQLAVVAQLRSRWDEAAAEFDRAVAIAPGSASVHYFRGHGKLYVGRVAEAVEELRLAAATDPYSSAIQGWLSMALDLANDLDGAYAAARRAWSLDSTSLLAQSFVMSIYANSGHADETRAVVAHSPRGHFTNGTRVAALAKIGDRAGAEVVMREIEARHASEWLDNLNLGYGYLALNDTSRAFAALERAIQVGEPVSRFLPFLARIYDPVRKSARFAAIVKHYNIDPAMIAAGRPAAK